MRKAPLSSVTTVRVFSMSTGLATSIVTPGRTAPDVSLTVPVKELWAYAALGSRRNRPAAHSAALNMRTDSLAIPQSFPLRRLPTRLRTAAGTTDRNNGDDTRKADERMRTSDAGPSIEQPWSRGTEKTAGSDGRA